MIINGTVDISFDSPHLGLPTGIVFSKNLAKLISTYQAERDIWNTSATALEEAISGHELSHELDDLLLASAVEKRQPNPEHRNNLAAQEALRYSKEATRQNARRANKLFEQITVEARVNQGELLEQAVKLEQTRLATVREAVTVAYSQLTPLFTEARTIRETVSRVSQVTDGPRVPDMQLPDISVTRADDINQRLAVCLDAAIAPAHPVLRSSENSFSQSE